VAGQGHPRLLILVPIESMHRTFSWSSFTPFLKYGDLLVRNRKFSLQLSQLTTSLGLTPFKYMEKLYRSW